MQPPQAKLDYATPTRKSEPSPRPRIATAALIAGVIALLSDAVFAIGIVRNHPLTNTNYAGFPALVLPLAGITLAAIGRPNTSSRAALGLAASGGSVLLGVILFIAFFLENMPTC